MARRAHTKKKGRTGGLFHAGASRGAYGRDDRIRTCDILLPKQARYQAAPRPEVRPEGRRAEPASTKAGHPQPNGLITRNGAGDGNRTRVRSLEGFGSTIEPHPHARRVQARALFYRKGRTTQTKITHSSHQDVLSARAERCRGAKSRSYLHLAPRQATFHQVGPGRTAGHTQSRAHRAPRDRCAPR